MNEVEKLYKLAHIEPIVKDEITVGRCCYVELKKVEILPQFTAEKQLRLIKLLASYGKYDPTRKLLLQCLDGEWYIAVYEGMDLMSNGSEVDFKECLARVINKLWQDLTEEQRQQIKEILR